MTNDDLRNEILDLEDDLKYKKQLLAQKEKDCNHKWSNVKEISEYKPSRIIPGDPPGVGGVDHRFETYVEAKTEKRWERSCVKCGKVESTTDVQGVTVYSPRF